MCAALFKLEIKIRSEQDIDLVSDTIWGPETLKLDHVKSGLG